MTIKHVLLDVYNLVQEKNEKFNAALIQTIAEATKYPWEECAYALTESVNHFRSLDPDGAFVCNPFDFVADIMARLEQSRYPASSLMQDIITLSMLYRPRTTRESIDTVRMLALNEVYVTLIANTNIVPSITIANQLVDSFPPRDVNFGMLSHADSYVQMPYDNAWSKAIATAKMFNEGISYANTLFVTTNAKFAKAAERTGMQVAVIGGPDELEGAIRRRLDSSLGEKGNQNAVLG